MTNILIVDDEAQIRTLLKRYLEMAGYACQTAKDVAAAMRILDSHPIDLILSDIDMPGASGFDLVRQVNENYPDTPMIMVSIIDKPEEAREALNMGVYGYIVKPFTRNIVLINVENALRRKRLEIEKKVYLDKLESMVRQRTEMLDSQLTFLQTLIDAIPSPIFYKNKEGQFQGCNTAFEMLAGKKRNQLIGMTASDIVPKLLADISHATDRKLISNPGKVAYEYDVVYPDNSIHNFLLNKATFLDSNGNVAGLAGVMVDITERKAAEEALRVSEEKSRQIVENIGIGVATISPDMKILWMNRQMRNWFPDIQAADHPICYRAFNTPPRENLCEYCPTVRTLKEGIRFEAITATPMNAGEHQFRIVSTPIHDKDGKVVAAIELVEDISEKITLERELRQSQKLEAIGQLAAGIAHEINTPIQYVGDNTRFLEDAFGDIQPVMQTYARLLAAVKANADTSEPVADAERAIEAADLSYLSSEVPTAIGQSLEGIQRVSRIIKAMRQFSHPGTDRKIETDLNQALESTITVSRNEWKYVADMETDFAAGLPAVPCFPGELNQVFLNLIINAAHAIGEKTDEGKQGKGLIRVSTRMVDDTVQIRIADNGGGIPASIRQRVFDPFFTTKPVGKGTGQGLTIAHAVIKEKHNGSIQFDSREGEGTTFTIALPIQAVTEAGPNQGQNGTNPALPH
ncbi:response regulator [uncultured Desulfosarcina sp.]|uniref:response regulator n=1 Tax=uncultured Desulfosarcina sp. TaxID=218289 RepID=UPI0029C6B058|nr:response regulator [uncultured Desulfosarcina sp.]